MSTVIKSCPICDRKTVKYNQIKNIFYCEECLFEAPGESTYGCTFLRGHVKPAVLCNLLDKDNDSEK